MTTNTTEKRAALVAQLAALDSIAIELERQIDALHDEMDKISAAINELDETATGLKHGDALLFSQAVNDLRISEGHRPVPLTPGALCYVESADPVDQDARIMWDLYPNSKGGATVGGVPLALAQDMRAAYLRSVENEGAE